MSSRSPIPDLTPLAVDEIVALQTIVAGVAHAIGDDFLRTLVEHKEAGIESYLGVPLKAEHGKVLGHLCVLDKALLPVEPPSQIQRGTHTLL